MKIKIAVIENNILASNTIRFKLVHELIKKDYDVTILTSGTQEAIDVARGNGFTVIVIPASKQRLFGVLKYLKNLKKSLCVIKPDMCLTFTIRPAIWGNIVTRKLKIPTITNITGIGPLFDNNSIAYIGARLLYKKVLKRTNVVFFQNSDDKSIFIEKGFVTKDQAFQIPGSGVDFNYFSPRPEREKDNKIIFLFISRLVRDKGIVEFINAARSLKQSLPRARFRVLGPLWNHNLKNNTVTEINIQEWCSEGIIEYFGDTDDVRPFIAAGDCIVLPSYREGTSNVLLEASSMGKPCITCNTTGCKEIVEDNKTGFLCRVKDWKDLANQIEKMYYLSDSQRIDMGKAARQKVKKEFDKNIVINAYLNMIDKILTSK